MGLDSKYGARGVHCYCYHYHYKYHCYCTASAIVITRTPARIMTNTQTQQTQQQPPLTTPNTVSLATATAAGQRDLETRNHILSDLVGSRDSTLPAIASRPPTINLYSPSNSAREMRHERGTDHDRSPIPQSTLRNSMNVQRPHFVHTNTEYHTYHQSSSSSSLAPSQGAHSNSDNNALPYRDHPLTKEEYPQIQQHQSHQIYNPSFPPRQPSQSRRNGRSSTPGPLPSGNIWDSTRCRLLDFKCRMCSREGAIGRGLMIGWVLTTLGFLLACAFWKGELFTGR